MEIPKEYRKNKKIRFYKAYLLNMNDQMDLHVDGDLFCLTEFNAVQRLINDLKINNEEEFKGKVITILKVSIPTELVDIDKYLMNMDGISITFPIKEFNEDYDLKVIDYEIKSIEFKIDPKSELRILSILEMDKISNLEKD